MSGHPTASDAFVFFGATGDLAFKKIFPALQAMALRGNLNAPVIAVTRGDWNLESVRARARASLEKHGGVDPAAFAKLCSLLRCVNGDYQDAALWTALRQELNGLERPTYYLAIPPSLFEVVIAQMAASGCSRGARVILEKPFGRDLPSARQLNEILHRSLDESAIYRIDHYLGKRPVNNMFVFRFANSFAESFWNRNYIESVQITMAEEFGVQGRGAFYDGVGTIRDVVQNHLFQVLSVLAMEPPVRADSESLRDEKVKVLKAIPSIRDADVVRGQFRGYLDEKGVAPGSQVETFAALRLEIPSWRWKGVPFYIRAGKCLPTTCTEVVGRFRKPPTVLPEDTLRQNHLRMRINPDVTIALGMNVMAQCGELTAESDEMVAISHPCAADPDAYERVLTAAMEGDASLFARQDYVEEAWRIVDPVLAQDTPVHPYTPGTWGPDEVARVTPEGGWENPVVEVEDGASQKAA
ncbi:MAG: glucose-6-phosphate dehydrogenase [Paludibaculum sp.]